MRSTSQQTSIFIIFNLFFIILIGNLSVVKSEAEIYDAVNTTETTTPTPSTSLSSTPSPSFIPSPTPSPSPQPSQSITPTPSPAPSSSPSPSPSPSLTLTPITLQLGEVMYNSISNQTERKLFKLQFTTEEDYISISVFRISTILPNTKEYMKFCVGDEPLATSPNVTYYRCAAQNEESLIVPVHESVLVNGTTVLQDISTLYILVSSYSNSSETFSISASPVYEALSDVYQSSEDRYIITGRVSSGLRQFFQFNASTNKQQIQIEICSSSDYTNNNISIIGAFLWNQTSDNWNEYANNLNSSDYPCSVNGTNGNIRIVYPTSSNGYMKICPSYVINTTPLSENTFFAIEVLYFWRYPLINGSLSYKITIDDSYTSILPLTVADQSTSTYIANFTITRSFTDAIISFPQLTTRSSNDQNNSTSLSDVQYALFSDFSFSDQIKTYLRLNTSLSSSCYLLNHQDQTIISSWYPNNQLTINNATNKASFIISNFYETYDDAKFDVNLVAYSHTRGSFAYSLRSIDTTDDFSIDIWTSTLMIVGSIAAAIATFLVLGVIGYFAYIKYRNRSKYELL